MGLFRRKEKEYTLGEILKEIKKDKEGKYQNYIAIQTRPGSSKYWWREEIDRKQIGVTNPILETKQGSSSVFEQKRDRFMSEVNGNGEYKNISYNTKPGRVVPSYNNYQSAKNYQKKYGQSR